MSFVDELKFQAMVQEIEADMTKQLARTHEPDTNRNVKLRNTSRTI